jgi:hypothetical protein
MRKILLKPVILATQEAEIRRIEVRSQPRQMVCETSTERLSSSILEHGAGEWQ